MFNHLLHGQHNEVVDILNHEDINHEQLVAALLNAFNRINNLEKNLSKITEAYAQGQRALMAIARQPKIDG